jgi:hypothetical protein
MWRRDREVGDDVLNRGGCGVAGVELDRRHGDAVDLIMQQRVLITGALAFAIFSGNF